jgi:cell division protein FtsI (penicillin-binding protein 3)
MRRPPVAPFAQSAERCLIMGLILTGWALIVVFRLFQLQVLAHEVYEKKGIAQQERIEVLEAPRGSILDRDGHLLAISSPSLFVAVNPGRIPERERGTAAALLAKVLELDATKLEADLIQAAASKRHHGYFVVDPHVSEAKADSLRAMKLDWLEIRHGNLRTYPNSGLASHVIGNVGAEGHGASGVELKLDKDLAGVAGQLRVRMDVKQRAYDSEIDKAPVIGKNVGLTINSALQHAAEEAIAQSVIKNHGEHGSIVAMNPNNGEILALANYPSYDPNERLHAGEKPVGRQDLAVVAPYEPGSVFKVITVASALETTRLTPQTMINCGGGSITLFGRTIHDSHPHGDLSVADVLAVSSNVGAIRIGMQVGAQNLYDYVRRFGIGQKTGIELPAESPGVLRRLNRWQPTSLPSVAFGHEVSTTIVQIARMGAVIANGGYLVSPHLVAWEQAPGGPKVMKQVPAPVRVLKPETVMTMRRMMERVVSWEHGTAHKVHVVGYSMAGKTGTAQIYDYAHHVYTHKYNASFMGFSPVNNPSILVISTVSGTAGEAGWGASASGPVVQVVASEGLRLMGVPPDRPEEIELLAQKDAEQQAKLNRKTESPETAENDSVAALSTPPDENETVAAAPPEQVNGGDRVDMAGAPVATTGPKVPNFVGETVQAVMQQAAAGGLDLDMMGEGLARAQYPPAGAALVPGEHIRVRFTR